MDYSGGIILACALVVLTFWAMALVTWAMKRTYSDQNRQLDCIMVLVDKEKAALAASMGHVRTRSNGKTGSDAVNEKRTQLAERRKKLQKLHDEIHENGGVITLDQESELAKYADIR